MLNVHDSSDQCRHFNCVFVIGYNDRDNDVPAERVNRCDGVATPTSTLGLPLNVKLTRRWKRNRYRSWISHHGIAIGIYTTRENYDSL